MAARADCPGVASRASIYFKLIGSSVLEQVIPIPPSDVSGFWYFEGNWADFPGTASSVTLYFPGIASPWNCPFLTVKRSSRPVPAVGVRTSAAAGKGPPAARLTRPLTGIGLETTGSGVPATRTESLKPRTRIRVSGIGELQCSNRRSERTRAAVNQAQPQTSLEAEG